MTKFHVRDISNNLHSMSVLYDEGIRATFLFLEHCDRNQPLGEEAKAYLEKGSKIIIDKQGLCCKLIANRKK